MKAFNGKAQPRPDPRGRDAQRRGLLAKIHIAKKELGLQDVEYCEILEARYKKQSAAALTLAQLEELVNYFIWLGWKPGTRRTRPIETKPQVLALRERAEKIALNLENGEARLRGLCKKFCDVDNLTWCWEVGPLKQVIAALEKIAKNNGRSKFPVQGSGVQGFNPER